MQSEKIKFSVVIPLYNKEKYIYQTIKSALDQSFQSFEVIVVDDGSTDHSLQEAKKIHSRRLHIIAQENQGVSVARNTGMKEAKGEFIAFLDADDIWERDYLLTIASLTARYPQCDLFVTAYHIEFADGRKRVSSHLTPKTGCLESYWLTYLHPYEFVWTSAMAVRKDAALKIGGFKPGEKVGQDLDFILRVARNNPKVAYSSKPCAIYNRNAEQNARTRVKIAYPAAFLKNLEQELINPAHSQDEMNAIQHKYDMKMTAYIYTCILAGERNRARKELKHWKGKSTGRRLFLKTGLYVAALLPNTLIRFVYRVRLKIF